VDITVASTLGQMIEYCLDELARDNGLFESHPLLARNTQCALVQMLVELTPNNYQTLMQRNFGGSARRHVRLLEEYIEAHLQKAISVGDMAHAVGVSVRTLRNSCQRLRSHTPEQLYRRLRLQAVHNRMENPQPEDTVVSVAQAFGFTNPGRFAEYYRERFHGETPVETLQRGRRRIGAKLIE
jgi:transcriptional regulator GlxA family with amidase domain